MKKKLAIFDFDGTLFHSPVPNRDRLSRELYGKLMATRSEGGYGWFQNEITLSPKYTTDIGVGFNSDVVKDAFKYILDDEYIVVMLTGRSEAFRSRIIELCDSVGLVFDEYLLKPSQEITTGNFKILEIDRLIHRYDIDEVIMWEDRPRHIKKFTEHLNQHPGVVSSFIHHITGGDTILPNSFEDELVGELTTNVLIESNTKPKVRKHTFYALVLDSESLDILRDSFGDLCPSDWNWHGHHMTIININQFKLMPDILNFANDNIGSTHTIDCVEIGANDECIALKVNTSLLSQNTNKHITLAVSPTGKARSSNNITVWKELPEKISISGTIEGVF